jgi:hypothetical protein
MCFPRVGIQRHDDRAPTPDDTKAKAERYAGAGMDSEGDPRVHAVMNLVLSFVFSLIVVQGLAFVDLATFSWRNVALATVFLFLVTWVVVLRK